MRLSPHEIDKCLLYTTGTLAQKRLARGLRLNIPESIALLSYLILELARDGKHSVAQLMDLGRSLLGRRLVIPGVSEVLEEVQVEGNFPDGTKLVTLHHPISTDSGNLQLCIYGSNLVVPDISLFVDHDEEGLVPGVIHTLSGSITLNQGRAISSIAVMNCSDRPIQVGSHYHFIETNPFLCFDRRASYGKRLNM